MTMEEGLAVGGRAGCLDFSKPLETKVIPPRKKKSEQAKPEGKETKGPESRNPGADVNTEQE